MPHNLAAPSQARSQDTLRWGGVVGVPIPAGVNLVTALQNAVGNGGKQLVNAHWRWPLSWRVLLVVTPQHVTGDFAVTFAITIGCGDAQQTILRTVVVNNGQTDSGIDNALALPAADILIVPSVITTDDTHPITGPGSIEIGAMVAPETEPHAMLHMLECLEQCGGADGAGERQGGWMPPGFYPEPLGYRR